MPRQLPFEVAGDPAELVAAGCAQDQVHLASEPVVSLDERDVMSALRARYAAGVTEVLLDRGSKVELVSRWPALFPTTMTTLDMAHLYSRLGVKDCPARLFVTKCSRS